MASGVRYCGRGKRNRHVPSCLTDVLERLRGLGDMQGFGGRAARIRCSPPKEDYDEVQDAPRRGMRAARRPHGLLRARRIWASMPAPPRSRRPSSVEDGSAFVVASTPTTRAMCWGAPRRALAELYADAARRMPKTGAALRHASGMPP